MLHGKPRTYTSVHNLLIIASFCICCASCKLTTIVKKYPPYKPFVFDTKIKVEGNYSTANRKDLETRLQNQLDDSMQVRSVSKVAWSELRHPPAFDTASADKSVLFMHLLMNKLGYFRDTIYYKVSIDSSRKKQY